MNSSLKDLEAYEEASCNPDFDKRLRRDGTPWSPMNTTSPARRRPKPVGPRSTPRRYDLSPLDWQTLARRRAQVEYIFEPYLPKGARIWIWGATGP